MFQKKPKKKPCKVAPQPRGPRGEGTVFPDKRRGGYRGKVPVGKYRNGQTRYKEVWGETQAACVAAKKLVKPPEPSVTLRDWATRWLEGLKHRPLTKNSYRNSATKWVIPDLGHFQVREITAYIVEEAAGKWAEKLRPNTVRLVLAHLRACLAGALRAGIISTNPVAAAKKPKGEKVKINPYTTTELARIVAAASEHADTAAVAVLAATGMRRGEVLGLNVSDYDPDAQTLAITKGDIGAFGLGPPKSQQSVRTIRLPNAAVPAVQAAIGGRKSGPLFVGKRTRERLGDGVIFDRYAPLIVRLELPHRNMHQLRHSVATALIGAGSSLADVAAYLGDTVETLVRVYLHPTKTDPSLALDDLLGGGKVAKPSRGKAYKPGNLFVRGSGGQ